MVFFLMKVSGSFLVLLNPLPDEKILDRFKLKQSPDANLKFHKNSRKLSKRVESTVGKGEIARYEQFLLFPQCFQKACFPGASKGVIVWEWVKYTYKPIDLPVQQCFHCYTLVIYQTTNFPFRLVQILCICRRKNKRV